jgi:hypothetical protein
MHDFFSDLLGPNSPVASLDQPVHTACSTVREIWSPDASPVSDDTITSENTSVTGPSAESAETQARSGPRSSKERLSTGSWVRASTSRFALYSQATISVIAAASDPPSSVGAEASRGLRSPRSAALLSATDLTDRLGGDSESPPEWVIRITKTAPLQSF